jgi:biotin synthase-related radical SAM superfamily protein
MKKIIYSPHLIFRLKWREIPYNLPREIYQTSKEHYFDRGTLKRVAIKKIKFKNKLREIALIYEEINNQINLITIHPLKKYQKISRIKSGRWQKIL